MFNMSSILFSLTAVQFVMAAILVIFWAARLRADGLKEMVIAVTVAGTGALITGIGAFKLNYDLIFFGPIGFIIAVLMAARSMRRLQHQPPRRALEGVALTGATVAGYYFVVVQHNVSGMLISNSVVFAVVTGLAAKDLIAENRAELRTGCRILGIMFAIFATLHVLRLFIRPWLEASPEWHGQIILLDFGFAFLGMVVSIGWSLGLIWAAYSSAEYQLRAAYEELDRFTSAVAHDLKSPLNAVIGNIEAVNHLAPKIDPEQKAHFLRSAHEAALRMNLFINDLLADARSARTAPQSGAVDPNTCLTAAQDSLRSLIEAVGAEFTVGSLPIVAANPLSLTRLFQNLLDNAIKYRSHDRPLKIDVSADRVDGMVRISVADNGLGIARADQHRVFERFARAGKQNLVQGDGLGLAECRRIAEKFGGTITLTSELGAGSTFTITLPAADVPN
ncbi:MAG: HAMP domain-containing sensor histidine kinase [Rhodospirillales bacterium]